MYRVDAAHCEEKAAIVDSFLTAVPSFPFTEHDTLVHFLYRGNASSITIPGDFNQWDPEAFPMNRFTDTNLWYLTRMFEPDARLDYKFVIDSSNWILDPRNPLQIMGGFGPNSELRMPGYVSSPEIEYDPVISHGTIFDTTFTSATLGNSRIVRIYIPASYMSSQDSFCVILFHDGLDYINLAHTVNVLDYLIDNQRIQPCIAIFVPAIQRVPEYAGELKNTFSSFIIEDLMVWADRKYRIRKHPENRVVFGASNGGNISLWMGLHYPHMFGKVAAQSSNVETSISNVFKNGPKLDLTFYLDIGTYDITYLIPLVRRLKKILDKKGYDYHYEEFHEGHSWGNWKAHLDNALEFLIPY
jgi:enterochelin esterase family protein